MISQEQIEEWIHEVETRQSTAVLIVRFIANRLRDLTQRNEELLSENIALRTEKRVEEYETRIANLEYQLEILKRQMGGDLHGLTEPLAVERVEEQLCVLMYLPVGRILRVDIENALSLASGQRLAQLASTSTVGERPPRLLVTHAQEELVFVFDSGRTFNMPVNTIPVTSADALLWKEAFVVEPRAGEELATVVAMGRLALADSLVQVSRRGCLKRMLKTSFETHLAKHYIGSGVLQKPDLNCSLVLAHREDIVAMVSREGYALGMAVERMPFTTEESIRLSVTDYIASAFSLARKPNLLFITQNGKAVTRESGWLAPAISAKSRGQSLISAARREAGTSIVGAAAVDEQDWVMVLLRSGAVYTYRAADLMANGALPDFESNHEVIDVCVFAMKQEQV